jgi:predicted RNase H-like HicB family nuclease
MEPTKQKFPFTAMLIKDPESSRWTAFFEECPQAVGEGETKELALKSAVAAFGVLGRMNKEEIESDVIPRIGQYGTVERQELELEFA